MREISGKRRLGGLTGVTPLLLLATLLSENTAQAQEFTSGGLGVFVGYGEGTVAWGLELFGSVEWNHDFCDSGPRRVVGPLTRVTLYGTRPSFTVAGHAGAELGEGWGVTGEVGGTLGLFGETTSSWGASPHTGFSMEAFVLNIMAQQEWLVNAYPVTGGVRLQPLVATSTFVECVVGRPQRDARGRCLVPELATRQTPGSEAPETLDPRALDWLADAQAEYASVPAFFQLATELLAAGAPPALAKRALSAVCDELEHTALCTEAASRFAKRALAPRVPQIHRRPALSGAAALRRLALESWIDGCLGEGLAAALAEDGATHSPDACSRETHAAIAPDERRHQQLAWDIVEWCLAEDATVAPLLRAALRHPVQISARAFECAERRQRVAAQHQDTARQRLRRYL